MDSFHCTQLTVTESERQKQLDDIFVSSLSPCVQVHILTFASRVYQRKPLLNLQIRLRSFLSVIMLKMQENAGIFGFPGLHLTHEGTLGGWRMLLVRPTGRNWATDRSGDWW